MSRGMHLLIILAALLAGCKANSNEVKPLRFFDSDVTISFDRSSDPQILTRRLVQFDQSSATDRVFVLPVGSENVNRYIEASATLLRKGEAPRPLEVKLATKRVKDLSGERYSLTIPTVSLPSTRATDQVAITFRTTSKNPEAISWLPVEPVDRARVSISAKGVQLHTAAYGFDAVGGATDGDRYTQVFVMQDRIRNVTSRSGESAPYVVATTFDSWLKAWDAEAVAFRAELKKEVVVGDIPPLTRYLSLVPASRTYDEKRKVASELYKWIAKEFQYHAAGLDPLYSTKPRPLEETWERRAGDCKDLSLLYVKLLTIAGIQAEPVLVPILNDRYLPRQSRIPSMLFFNHAIVHLPELGEYIDLTAAGLDDLGELSAGYAHTFGGHLFTGEYRAIKPDSVQTSVKVETTIQGDGEKWIGRTVWTGAGLGQSKIRNAQNVLRDRMTAMENPAFLSRLGMRLVPGSWSERRDKSGETSAAFSFELNTSPADASRKLAYLPKAFTAGNLLKYELKGELDKVLISPCQRTEHAEESLRIEGISSANTDGIADIRVVRGGLAFTQRIEIRDGALWVERNLDIDEPRVVCSPQDAEEQRAFFAEVRTAVERTAVTISGANL